jgi:branched-chain amino acid transport system permease protein
VSEAALLAVAQLLEVLLGGLMSGVLYALVALGFVLIFKASGVFNFAQGAMVLFAALSLVRIAEVVPLPVAFALTVLIMTGVAFLVERVVLRPLVGQDALTLFMATIGIAFFLDGFGQQLWGSNVYQLDLGIPAAPWFILDPPFPGGVLLSPIDAFAAVVAGGLVLSLSLFFHGTKVGRALRAVADDHQAAQSIGIPLNRIWLIVWSVAGVVALVAGMAWGTKLGVQFSLALIALKALPVLIVGGLTSIPGAIVGGLLIGAGEKLAEVYLGPVIGGGLENWFAYVVALIVLLFRPQGLFGERIIERV